MRSIIWLVIASLFVFGCSSEKTTDIPVSETNPQTKEVATVSRGGTVVDSNIADMTVLNPVTWLDRHSMRAINLIFNGLYRLDKNLLPEPDLAIHHNYSKDMKEFTFFLNNEAKWHDGMPVTAHDVKFTFDLIRDPSVKTRIRDQFKLVSTLEVLDGYTVKASYSKPDAYALYAWTSGILPKHIYSDQGFDSDRFNRSPVGSGPFMFVGRVEGEKLVKEVLKGHGFVTSGPFSPKLWMYDQSVKPYPYSPEKAREMFSETGFYNQNSRMSGFEIWFNPGNRMKKLTAKLIKEDLEKIGIKAIPRAVDFSEITKKMIKREFDAVIVGFTVVSPNELYAQYHSSMIPSPEKGKGGINFAGYSEKELNLLLDQAFMIHDQNRKKEISKKLHRLFHSDQPHVFLYSKIRLTAVNKRIRNIKPSLHTVGYDSMEWFVPEKLRR